MVKSNIGKNSQKSAQPSTKQTSIKNRLKSLYDGLSKYFSITSKRRATSISSSNSRSTISTNKLSGISSRNKLSGISSRNKLSGISSRFAKKTLRGDKAEMLVDGLSEFFKTTNSKRRSSCRDESSIDSNKRSSSTSASDDNCKYKTKRKNLSEADGEDVEESTASEITVAKKNLTCKESNKDRKFRNNLQKMKLIQHKKKAMEMSKRFKKCRLLNGLKDGLSHLYTTQGMRQRKSLHFYRDKIYRSSRIEATNFLRNIKETALNRNCKMTSENKKVAKDLKVSKQEKPEIKKKYGNMDVFPEEDCILFKKAVKRASKFLDQQDKSAEKDSSIWPSFIEIGQYEVATWYSSPYPNEYSNICKLYICEFCLKYLKSHETLSSHLNKCQAYRPPGEEIYHEGNLSVFQVDGNVNRSFCQNLCLLAKLYLQHKTLYRDVEPFLFYVLTTNDSRGCHIVGYFSKEKYCQQKFNLSCLMTLPQYQRQGYGRFLIEFSYLLSRKEGIPGTPEKPLSDLGKLSYHSYWKSVAINFFHQHCDDDEILIEELSRNLGIASEDILSTLASLNMIGQSKDSYVIVMNKEKIKEMHTSIIQSQHIHLNEDKLKWDPLVFMNNVEK